MFRDVRKRAKKAGQPPGTPVYTGTKKDIPPVYTVITYNTDTCRESEGPNLEACLPPEQHEGMIWINTEGLSDIKAIETLALRFNIHPLTIEDILNVEQRPKVEEFDHYIFVTLKLMDWQPKKSRFTTSQLSIVFGENFVLSFQEADTSLFDAIRARLKSTPNQRMRQQGSDYLVYRLIDAVVDQYFVILEALGEQLEDVEENIISSPTPQNARTIYRLKRQMLILRKAIWPMREAINHLLGAEDNFISKFTRVYLRDVYDHTMQAIDTLETFRDMLSGMLDMYLSGLTIRMNEIMKTLTIITTLFIPITALASIYGMNLIDIPLMKSHWGFPAIASLMLLSAIMMTIYFRRKHWI